VIRWFAGSASQLWTPGCLWVAQLSCTTCRSVQGWAATTLLGQTSQREYPDAEGLQSVHEGANMTEKASPYGRRYPLTAPGWRTAGFAYLCAFGSVPQCFASLLGRGR